MVSHGYMTSRKDGKLKGGEIAFYQLKQVYRVVEVLNAQYSSLLNLHLGQSKVGELMGKEKSSK